MKKAFLDDAPQLGAEYLPHFIAASERVMAGPAPLTFSGEQSG